MSRKKAFNLLSLCLLAVLFYSCGSNAFKGIADDSSQEACRYEVTKNLDSGNWDAVLNSSCADSMQKGAAYFGRAGFDIKDVINRLSEASGEEDDLNIYLKALVPKVTEQTLNDLSMAKSEYDKVPQGDPHYKDAQFYISLVDTSYSLSLMKIVIDSDGDGAISNCDINGNTVPDDADATACALMASVGFNENSNLIQSCGTYATAYIEGQDIHFEGKNGTYRGMKVNITGSPTSECPASYDKLLYKDGEGKYYVATTSGTCTDINNVKWPCPIEVVDENNNKTPYDFVTAIDDSLKNATDILSKILPNLNEDVVNAINEIREKACGLDKKCTSQEIANYIQNYLSIQ